MFKIIEPKNHVSHLELIFSSLNMIKNNLTIYETFQSHKNAKFVLSTNEADDIFGGAIILEQSFYSLHNLVQRNILKHELKKEHIWLCTVFVSKENYIFSQHFDFLFCSFYQNLYRKIIEIAGKESTSFFYMMLEPGEYLCTEALGGWSYIWPFASFNGIYHGILSLKALASHSLKEMGRKTLAKEIKLAA